MLKLFAVVVIASLTSQAAPAFAAENCGGSTRCVETRSFVATVANFRISKSGRNRVLTATVNFRNKTGQPLTLGYVSESGVALDARGNRYLITDYKTVRGIGVIINGMALDTKFTLAPGDASDARFELVGEPGQDATGATYELDLAVREILPTATEQFRLGSEHTVHFDQLAEGGAAAAPAAAKAPAAATDPCGGSSRCYNAGSFVADVVQLSATSMSAGARHQSISLNIRFRNISDKPIILAYKSATSSGLDNFGQKFYWGRPGTHDTSVQGIGMVTGRAADTQFALAPGQGRSATFGLIRYQAVPPIGNAWNYNVVIDELEILPGQQVRTVRENSLSFQNLTAAGSFAAAAAATPGTGDGTGVPGVAPATPQDVANQVIGLFKKLTEK